MFEYEHPLARWLALLPDCPLAGVEASVKISARGICGDRFLVGIERRNLDWNLFEKICASMQLPGEHLAPLNAAFGEANQVGFGFEADGSRVVHKIYLEFWNRLVLEIRSNPRNIAPRPLHIGLKWEPATPGRVAFATYTCFPLLPIHGILRRLALLPDPDSISRETTRKVIERAAQTLRNDAFLYLEAGEEGTERRSYDLNLYKAKCCVKDMMDLLDAARAGYGLPEQATRRLEAAGDRPLGHIGGGQARDGSDYLTVYYEIDRLPL